MFRCKNQVRCYSLTKVCVPGTVSVVLLLLIALFGNSADSNPYKEAFCGDIALSCITTCPAFKQKCYGTHVDSSIKNARPETTGVVNEINRNPYPVVSPASFDSLHQRTCVQDGHPCYATREYEKTECCSGRQCSPFKHNDGRIASIGICKAWEGVV